MGSSIHEQEIVSKIKNDTPGKTLFIIILLSHSQNVRICIAFCLCYLHLNGWKYSCENNKKKKMYFHESKRLTALKLSLILSHFIYLMRTDFTHIALQIQQLSATFHHTILLPAFPPLPFLISSF